MTVFISHSSRDRDLVQKLVKHIEAGHQQVWLDQELTGGQAWWDEILEQIRSCTVFVFALSDNSRISKPCRAELDYARALGLPILPVQIGDTDSYRIDPLFSMHLIDYRNPDVDSSIQLITALREKAAERTALPDPLPQPPPIPYEYLQRLGNTIESSDSLSVTEQSVIVIELRQALTDEHDASVRDDIKQLLRTLRRRSDVTFSTAKEIDALLEDRHAPPVAAPPLLQQPAPPVAPVHQENPPPAPWSSGPMPAQPVASAPFAGPPAPPWSGPTQPVPPKRTNWIPLAIAGAAVLLVVVGLVIWIAVSSNNSSTTATGPTSTSTTTTASPTSTPPTSAPGSTPAEGGAVAKLRDLLPKGYPSSACQPDQPLGDALATMKCGPNTQPGGPSQGLYSIYSSADAAKGAFDRLVSLEGSKLLTCPGSDPSPTTWHHNATPDVAAGALSCQSYKSIFMIMWTDDGNRTLFIANGDQLDSLYAWWQKSG